MTPEDEKKFEEICIRHCQHIQKFNKMATFSLGFGGGVLGGILALFGFMKSKEYFDLTTNNSQIMSNVSSPIPNYPPYEQCSVLQDKVDNLTTTIQRLEQDLKKNQSDLKMNMDIKSYSFEEGFKELGATYLSKEWFLVIILLGVFEIAVMAIVWNMWRQLADVLSRGLNIRVPVGQRDPSFSSNPSEGGVTKIPGHKKTLAMVCQGDLERSICVISFHSSTLQDHHAKVKAVMGNDQSLEVSQKHVSTHGDILSMPRCKLYFLFVDFNERNVILEDSCTGLGDLRLTTVQAIKKMGGEMVLIYSGHSGSRTLDGDKLYNSGLTSISRHPELRRLSGKQRVLTVYEDFHEGQKTHLAKVIKDVCG